MATLSAAAVFAKKAFVWTVLGTVTAIFLLIIINISRTIKNALVPPKPLPATVAFGKLPKLDLTEGIRPPSDVKYNLETISGELPQLANSAKVFAILPEEVSFGDLERAQATVSKIGFTGEGQALSGTTLKFTDLKNAARTIIINVTDGNFQLSSNFWQEGQIISSRPNSVEGAKEQALDFFRILGPEINQFPKEKIDTRLFRIDGQFLTEVPALGSANLVEVIFGRADIDKLAVINPRESSPSASALVGRDKIVAAGLWRLSIEFHKFASYPLKGTTKAFEDLKAGKGHFNKELKGGTFPIRDVALAYLETKKSQGFLQPVYVFKSDSGLVSYVSAVDDFWTQ